MTPDGPGTVSRRVTLTIPADPEWRAALLGALLLLGDERNWEQYGAMTPEQVSCMWTDIMLDMREGMDIGTVFHFAGQTCPSFALICDGGEHRSSDYPVLSTLLGDLYGAAAPGHFRVPNLAARVVRGTRASNGDPEIPLATTGGSDTVTLSVDQMPAHGHQVNNHDHSVHDHFEALAMSPGELRVSAPFFLQGSTGGAQPGTSSVGGGQAHENWPPYIALLPCIVAR